MFIHFHKVEAHIAFIYSKNTALYWDQWCWLHKLPGCVLESEKWHSACLKQAMMFGAAGGYHTQTPLNYTSTSLCCYPAFSAYLSADWVEQTVCPWISLL